MGEAEMREEHLARAVLDGGAERAAAERRLCELLAPRVHLYALRRLKSYADAADVTQETPGGGGRCLAARQRCRADCALCAGSRKRLQDVVEGVHGGQCRDIAGCRQRVRPTQG